MNNNLSALVENLNKVQAAYNDALINPAVNDEDISIFSNKVYKAKEAILNLVAELVGKERVM